MGLGQITKEHFENIPLKTMGTDVTLYRVRYSEDFRGTKTTTFGTAISIKAVIQQRSQTFIETEAGRFQESPAFMMSKIGDRIKKGDKIKDGDKTWRVLNTINRHGIFVYSDLYLYEDKEEDEISLTGSDDDEGGVAPSGPVRE